MPHKPRKTLESAETVADEVWAQQQLHGMTAGAVPIKADRRALLERALRPERRNRKVMVAYQVYANLLLKERLAALMKEIEK